MSNPTDLENGQTTNASNSDVKPSVTTAAEEHAPNMNGTDASASTTASSLGKASDPEPVITPTGTATSVLDKTVEADDEMEEEDDEEEVPDEEEQIFISLEQQKEQEDLEEALHPHAQPKDVTAAPVLLQRALKEGQVKADESEEESDKEKKAPVEEAKAPPSPEPHYHQRVSHGGRERWKLRFLAREC
jgi:hypothetical protein